MKAAFQADGLTVFQFNEPAGGQTVFHLHVHVIPRREGVPLKRHEGGMADNAVLAEQAARIRAALDATADERSGRARRGVRLRHAGEQPAQGGVLGLQLADPPQQHAQGRFARHRIGHGGAGAGPDRRSKVTPMPSSRRQRRVAR